MGFLIVFLGGGLGAALRHGVNLLSARLLGTGFNYATLFENVSGSVVMGLLVGYFAFKGGVPQHWRLFLTTGILGGYTTFSAFSRYHPALPARRAWPRGALRHSFRRALGRRPAGWTDAGAALRMSGLAARAIPSSTSFSAPFASSHLTIVTHLPFSKSL
jgi:protein CrcB